MDAFFNSKCMDDNCHQSMSSATNNSSGPCDQYNLSLEFWNVYSGAYNFAYYIVMPVFFVCGLGGHVICLIAFAKAIKKDSAYSYQMFVSISQATEVVLYAFYVLTLKWWSGVERDGAVWFRNNYGLMFYAARLATPLSNMCITTSLLLSLSTAVDRFWALYRPHQYRFWKHRRNRLIALIVSVFLGSSTSVFALFRYQIILNDDNSTGGAYKLDLDVVYASTSLSAAMSHSRNLFRMTALIVLIACNTVNLRLFRSRVLKVDVEANVGGASKQKSKLAAERTLFVLVAVESTLSAFGMTSLTAYFFAIFTKPIFAKCSGLLMIPLVDVILNLTNMGKFYIVWAVDLRFRKMIREVVGGCKGAVSVDAQSKLGPSRRVLSAPRILHQVASI